MRIFRSSSSGETAKFGREFAEALSRARSPRAAVFALKGDLGAGKTTFVQGFMRGLGIRRRVTSPTFVIMRRFAVPRAAGRPGAFSNVYHIDAYRIKKPDALKILGFQEIIADPRNIILVEWPENVKKFLPKAAIWLAFEHGKTEDSRTIRFL